VLSKDFQTLGFGDLFQTRPPDQLASCGKSHLEDGHRIAESVSDASVAHDDFDMGGRLWTRADEHRDVSANTSSFVRRLAAPKRAHEGTESPREHAIGPGDTRLWRDAVRQLSAYQLSRGTTWSRLLAASTRGCLPRTTTRMWRHTSSERRA
jgi:hypothetical protein